MQASFFVAVVQKKRVTVNNVNSNGRWALRIKKPVEKSNNLDKKLSD